MKQFIINLEKKDAKVDGEYLVYDIPIYEAFGVTSYIYRDGCVIGFEDEGIMIKDGKLYTRCSDILEMLEERSTLIIYYCDIRDYKLLFPKILKNNKQLAERLGRYYYEAEKAFESESWLTYSLMCAAIYEGLLYFKKIHGKDFNEKIDNACSQNIISKKEKDLMHIARQKRNLVHANNYDKKYVLRHEAVDMRTTMDNLIYRLG